MLNILKTLTDFDGHLAFVLAMKRSSQLRLRVPKMPSPSHAPSPSSLMFSMRSRSLSPLSGSETLPFHSGEQWCEQDENSDENTVLLDYQDHKGIAF